MRVRKDFDYLRSEKGTKDKYNEAIDILEYSWLMTQFFNVQEFNHVIAVQLRILLCDTTKDSDYRVINNSLINRIEPNLKLYPVTKLETIQAGNEVYAYVPKNFFDYSQPMIDLSSWLDQVILKMTLLGKLQTFTIRDFIKGYANKSGGAHVDKVLKEKNLIIEDQGEKLSTIAEGFLKSIGRDYKVHLLGKLNYLRKPFEQK